MSAFYPKPVITTLIFLFRLGNPFPGCNQSGL